MAVLPEDMTPTEMLSEVKKAIHAVLVGGQSYTIGLRSLTRADLSLLKSMRDDLEAQVTAGINSAEKPSSFPATSFIALC